MNLTVQERAGLQTFDALAFEVFSRQDRARLGESHAPTSACTFDGYYTDGIDRYIAGIGAWFAWAPDPRVDVHRCGWPRNSLTAVTGVLTGTFTKPMPADRGGTIAPTGQAFALDMVTAGIWNRQGAMDEELFFWG